MGVGIGSLFVAMHIWIAWARRGTSEGDEGKMVRIFVEDLALFCLISLSEISSLAAACLVPFYIVFPSFLFLPSSFFHFALLCT